MLADRLVEAGVDPPLAARLAEFGVRLLAANARTNLTGAKTPEDLLPHLLDCLTLLPYVRGPLVDVGSGGGLPAIPLALALGIDVTLIESTGKKCVFLESAMRDFGIAGRVLAGRAEDIGKDSAFRERFACGTARAVAAAPTVLELVLPLVAVGGVAVLQRGRFERPEREAVADAAPMLGGLPREVIRLSGERCLLIVDKKSATPGRYPRRAGIPEKRPLCLGARKA